MFTNAFARHAAGVVTVVAVLGTLAGPALAAGKPSGDLVPAGAHVLLFTSSGTGLVGTSTGGTISVTNPTVIGEVRDMINGLPISDTRHRVCPDDMMIPSWVSFSTGKGATPFTRVLFQLGGCPYARVYQDGVAISPTLGGADLGVVYSRIKKIVDAAR